MNFRSIRTRQTAGRRLVWSAAAAGCVNASFNRRHWYAEQAFVYRSKSKSHRLDTYMVVKVVGNQRQEHFIKTRLSIAFDENTKDWWHSCRSQIWNHTEKSSSDTIYYTANTRINRKNVWFERKNALHFCAFVVVCSHTRQSKTSATVVLVAPIWHGSTNFFFVCFLRVPFALVMSFYPACRHASYYRARAL